eukprot:m.14124 g.14124  ORF g.14124 m.14124 type:complete len:169 (-) comp10008_c0_seq1:46-552(-)
MSIAHTSRTFPSIKVLVRRSCHRPSNMSNESGDEPVRSIEDVFKENEEFEANERKRTTTSADDVVAIRFMMSDVSQALKVKVMCNSVFPNVSKWIEIENNWRKLSTLSDTELGANMSKVIEEMDAPHLKPASMFERMQAGNSGVCYGLHTLLNSSVGKLPKEEENPTE